MKPRRLVLVTQMLVLFLVGIALILGAGARARANALTAFANYRATWPDAWRAPVEHRAVEVLDGLLADPESDPDLARAAMGVMRQSSTWSEFAQSMRSRLRGVLDVRMKEPDDARLRIAWELFALSEPADLDQYRDLIIGRGGDRTALTASLRQAAARLNEAEPTAADAALDEVTQTWDALLGPLDGRSLPWLARQSPAIVGAENIAQEAVLHLRRRLLELYGLRPDAAYGRMQPDQAMIEWLDRQASEVNGSDASHRLRLEKVDAVIRAHAVGVDEEPVVELATRIALRHRHLPWSAVLVGIGMLAVLIGGLLHAFVRLRRGPLPIDVNAETMENVEPIDLDTDAETRSRSSASITDVG